jgi:uncharacterized membrane protein YcaP (DUF421 family)
VEALNHVWDLLDRLLGLQLQARDLEFSHLACRSLVVFCAAILLARVADRRFMGHNACYDFMLGVILGSVLSRGINGQARFFPTLGASALLVILHRVVGTIAFHSHWFSEWVKGREYVLVRNGKVDEQALRKNKITYDDLCENLRTHGKVANVTDVAEARLERNGQISVVLARQ